MSSSPQAIFQEEGMQAQSRYRRGPRRRTFTGREGGATNKIHCMHVLFVVVIVNNGHLQFAGHPEKVSLRRTTSRIRVWVMFALASSTHKAA